MKIGELDVIMVHGRCRQHLCHEDDKFIASRLGSQTARSEVADLLRDSESRDILLDDPALFELVQEGMQTLSISSNLYFYVILRKVLKDVGMDDRRIVDYLADLLSSFLHPPEGVKKGLQGEPLLYLCSLMKHLNTVRGRERFCAGVYIGNYALILGGIYPERILSDKNEGLDGKLAFLETVGSVNFNLVSRGEYALRHEMKETLRFLGGNFRSLRVALNRVAEFITVSEAKQSLETAPVSGAE